LIARAAADRGVEVFHTAAYAQVGGVVDDGLDTHGPAVFEVLLDTGVLVEGVQGDALVGAVDGGGELVRAPAGLWSA